MGEKTGIAWTDHTFNPWIGCRMVSEGCANCYAARQNEFYKWVEKWNGPRKLTSAENWKKPLVWAKKACAEGGDLAGFKRRIFCASLADILDPEVDGEWRNSLWHLIDETGKIGKGKIEWLLLTKRHDQLDRLPEIWRANPPDYVRLGVTAENAKWAERRISYLLKDWGGKNFISVEPILGPMDLSPFLKDLHWVIVGAESGSNARPANLDWMRWIRSECQGYGVPFFLKQAVLDGKLTKLPLLDGRQWAEYPKC